MRRTLARAGRIVAALLWIAAAGTATASPLSMLVADTLRVESATRTLVAEGGVEIVSDGTRLRARRLVYDGRTGMLKIDGPIELTDEAGTRFLADQAELSEDLTRGVLTGARLVLEDQLQIAAARIERRGGRYTALERAVASSCRVCSASEVPVWEIRARRILHDQEARQLYLNDAQLRLMGVPVFYSPWLRFPDPTLKRATGFLRPEFLNSSRIGAGIKVPYFVVLGERADLTFTPFVTTKGSKTLGLRYRQRFARGGFDIEGALTTDDLTAAPYRGYTFAEGAFSLPAGYTLRFNLETATDSAYLLDYGVSSKDRLESSISVDRTGRNSFTELAFRGFHSFRSSDINAEIPGLMADLTQEWRFHPDGIGGEVGIDLTALSYRRSRADETIGPARDATRISLGAQWRRDWTFGPGLVAEALGRVDADHFVVAQDSTYPGTISRVLPQAAVKLSWPLRRVDADGAVNVLVPTLQLVAAPSSLTAAPNEDSTIVEFDGGNLFGLSRFPGADARETGTRLNMGLDWTRTHPDGWETGVLVGRVLRKDASSQFSLASGLSGTRSDWLAVTRLSVGKSLHVANRALVSDGFSLSENELRVAWHTSSLDLATSFLWLGADAAENRATDTSEWTMDAAWRFRPNWTATTNWRYDFTAERASIAGVGLVFMTECIRVDFSLSRRFTSSTSVSPSTSFGMALELVGFGGSRRGAAVQRCTG